MFLEHVSRICSSNMRDFVERDSAIRDSRMIQKQRWTRNRLPKLWSPAKKYQKASLFPALPLARLRRAKPVTGSRMHNARQVLQHTHTESHNKLQTVNLQLPEADAISNKRFFLDALARLLLYHPRSHRTVLSLLFQSLNATFFEEENSPARKKTKYTPNVNNIQFSIHFCFIRLHKFACTFWLFAAVLFTEFLAGFCLSGCFFLSNLSFRLIHHP